MRKIIPLIFSVFYSFALFSQANGGWGTCEFATVVTMNTFDPSGSNLSCKKVYVQATDEHYRWNGSAWVLESADVDNIYRTNGTLSADRTLTGSSNSLFFNGLDSFYVDGVNIELDGSNDINFFAGNTINFELDATDGKGLYIATDGDVGIGTSSPDAKLDVEGGTLRLSDYGGGTETGTETYYLGVTTDGDVVEIDRSIDAHSDVDITTSAPSTGDMLIWDGSNFVPQDTDNGYTIFSIWAEENSNIAAGNYEWAFGNGSNTPNGDGIVIPIDCELFAMSLNHAGGSNSVVRIVQNTDASLSTYQVQTSGAENGYNTFGTPLSISAGDVLNFTTISASPAGSQARVSAWFRIRSTPASTSLVNDMLDVSAGSISSDQILQYDGSSFVNVDLDADIVNYDNSTSGLTSTDVQAAIDELAGLGSGTDDQALSIASDILTLEDGGSVDLSSYDENIYNTDGTLSSNRTLSLANFYLRMDMTGTGDFDIMDNGTQAFSVKDNGLVAIGDVTPVAPLHIYETTGTSATNTTGSLFLEHGDSGGTSSIVFKSTVNSTSDYAYIQYNEDGSGNGSTSENGLLSIGVENDILGDIYQDDIAILPSGALGVGTTSPDAFLDVDGGSVRFSDYGTGTYEDTTAVYLMGVEADGDLMEMNTAKNSRIFYPPALVIDASSTGTNLTLDLHQQYIDLFGSPAIASSGAPSVIPTYAEDELYYYVTDYDNTVFSNLSISAAGVLTYDIDAVPTDNCAILNVVFVVK